MARKPKQEQIAKVQTLFGDDVVDVAKPAEFIPTGFAKIDYELLGHGGLMVGRVHEFRGISGGCKSLTLYRTIANAQRKYPDKLVGVLDTEGNRADDALWLAWLQLNGIDLSRLRVFCSGVAEVVFNKFNDWLESGEFSVIGLDSVANMATSTYMAPQTDKYKRFGDGHDQPGVDAKIVTQEIKRVAHYARETGTTVVIVNQRREKIGSMGDSESAPGGRNLEHNRTTCLRFTPIKKIVTGEDVVGHYVKVDLVRSKLGSAKSMDGFMAVYFDGIDANRAYELVEAAIAKGVFNVSGAWFTWPEQDLRWQGRTKLVDAVKEWLADSDTEAIDTLVEAIEAA